MNKVEKQKQAQKKIFVAHMTEKKKVWFPRVLRKERETETENN